MAQLAQLHTSPPPRTTRLRTQGRGSGLLSLVALLAIWSVAAAWLARTSDRADVLLPSPLDVVQSIPGLSVFAAPGADLTYANATRVIVDNTIASGGRLLAGLLLGIALGVGAGLLLGWNQQLRYLIEGPLLLIRVIPLLALLPLFLAWFGGREIGAIAFIAYATF